MRQKLLTELWMKLKFEKRTGICMRERAGLCVCGLICVFVLDHKLTSCFLHALLWSAAVSEDLCVSPKLTVFNFVLFFLNLTEIYFKHIFRTIFVYLMQKIYLKNIFLF